MPFKLIWAVDRVNHRFYPSPWFNWKLSAHTLKVWERDLLFTVIATLVMEFLTLLHTASPLRLLPTSKIGEAFSRLTAQPNIPQGELECKGSSHHSGDIGRRGRNAQFRPNIFIFFHILDCFWSLKSSLRLQNSKTNKNCGSLLYYTHINTHTYTYKPPPFSPPSPVKVAILHIKGWRVFLVHSKITQEMNKLICSKWWKFKVFRLC